MSEGRIALAADDIQRVASDGGGVYSTRRRLTDKTEVSLKREKVLDIEVDSVEKASVNSSDFKKHQVFTGWTLLWLAYQSIGVIYGDIGTSSLYVYSSTFSGEPSYGDLLGALSLIIWALTIMVTVKYMIIVLYADDEGEGGTFALYSLISRYARIAKRDPREETLIKMERYNTGDMKPINNYTRSLIEHSTAAKWTLKVVGVLGVSLMLSEGVLTPAQSILGAIQGITVVNENITNSTVVGVSCAILVIVFLIQPFGTSKLSIAFSPIVIIWLTFNFSFGIYNLTMHDASVLKAFSPYFAGAYLVRNGFDGWVSLGGILLAFTGVEALFADLGAFSRTAVQFSWLFFTYPCLLLGYIGQAAYISEIPSAYTNPFYLTVPPGMLWPSLIIAVLTCIVASQATITAAFQLLSQIMKLSYFPQMKVIHTSKRFHGQIYIPTANWILMVGTVIVTGIYNNTTRIGHAYGVCVILVTFLTTCMVGLIALVVWRFPIYLVLPVFLVFAAFDGAFLSSALTKIPDGGWFTLAIAFALCILFIIWRFGKEQQWRAESSENVPLSQLLHIDSPKAGHDLLQLKPAFGDSYVTPVKGLGIFFDKVGSAATTPTVFLHFVRKFTAVPQVVVFFHLRPLSIPTVEPEDRFTVTRCFTATPGQDRRPIPNCFRLLVRHGYTDEVVTPDLGMLVKEQIGAFLLRENSDTWLQTTGNGTIAVQISALQKAYDYQVVYIVGGEQMRVNEDTNLMRKIVLSMFLWLRENSRSKVQNLNVGVDRLVQVGFVKQV